MSQEKLFDFRYQDIKLLQTGGTAEIFLAYDPIPRRTVVIKRLLAELSQNEALRAKFRREATLQGRINSPAIAKIYDYVEYNGRQWIVMEYLPGKSLWEYFQSRKETDLALCSYIDHDLTQAIKDVHAQGVIHCDLKPLNFVYDETGQLKLLDFGEARAADEEESSSLPQWISPLYMSPEQARGDPISYASDWYSLGVILYQLYCGKLPFRYETTEEMAQAHQNEIPPDPRLAQPLIEPQTARRILSLLHKDPAARTGGFPS